MSVVPGPVSQDAVFKLLYASPALPCPPRSTGLSRLFNPRFPGLKSDTITLLHWPVISSFGSHSSTSSSTTTSVPPKNWVHTSSVYCPPDHPLRELIYFFFSVQLQRFTMLQTFELCLVEFSSNQNAVTWAQLRLELHRSIWLAHLLGLG
jgi:hypothetical protein